MTNLLVLGGSGRTGIHVLEQAATQDAGDNWPRLNPLVKRFVKLSNLNAGFADHDGLDQVTRACGTDWTLVRAVALSDKPATGPPRATNVER